MRTGLLSISMFFIITSVLCQTATFSGSVSCKESLEPVIFGTVALYKDGKLVTGTDTDIEGKFKLNNLSFGVYKVKIQYLGYRKLELDLLANNAYIVRKYEMDIGLDRDIDYPACGEYYPNKQLFDLGDTSSGRTFYSSGGFLQPSI